MLENYLNENLLEAGCDEVGRGCLAGPVVAAAVILPKDFCLEGLNDSKKLSEKKRYALAEQIKEKAVAWAIAECSAAEVDEINVLNASFLAMTRAVEALSVTPEFLLIDGNRFKSTLEIDFECIVKGDGKYMSIAAASILAKCHRDSYITELSKKYPEYQWSKNKAYPTATHRRAIEKHGITPHHRLTFAGVR